MDDNRKDRYLIIHGHFYQPPRENPWTERIDRQDSAAPWHDWNERITAECYVPNGWSRRIDGYGRILRLVNNYAHISFNFGPTLLSWIESRHPGLYQRILEADEWSASRAGSGNAIAQVYNHIIMPLAERRDQETQIRWGVEDFERRFGRSPGGIWLAETAINEETLEILIDFGFRFIILSPHQAGRFKELGGGSWNDVSNGSIPTGRPYRCFGARRRRTRKRWIDIFFYDARLSTAVSFEHLLHSGDRLADQVEKAYGWSGGDLVTIATDGEVYGHHEPFADMALSYLIDVAAPERGLTMTNFPAYLDSHEPEHEVQIKLGPNGEGTAWSCSHGVGRWKENCGCSIGHTPGWDQEWRAPLRDSLDDLRDELASIFTGEASGMVRDPWRARDRYIDVILDRTVERARSFAREEASRDLDADEQARLLSLLEAQRNALLMFTSCGWFFDDISNIETTQLMKYAGRAIELAGPGHAETLEKELIAGLSKAKSNIPKYGTGADLYREAVEHAAVDADFLAGQYVLARYLGRPEASPEDLGYRFATVGEFERRIDGGTIETGIIEVVSPFTLEQSLFGFMLFLGVPAKMRCMLCPLDSMERFDEMRAHAEDLPPGTGPDEAVQTALDRFGGHVVSLRDLFIEDRETLLGELARRQIESHEDDYERFYIENRDMLRMFSDTWLTPPASISVPAETFLSRKLEKEISRWERSIETAGLEGIGDVVSEAKHYGIRLDRSRIADMFTEVLLERLRGLEESFEAGACPALLEFVEFGESIDVEIHPHDIQNSINEILVGPVEGFLSRAGGDDAAGAECVKAFLELAKRFNFNVEDQESRLPGSGEGGSGEERQEEEPGEGGNRGKERSDEEG